MIKQLSDSSRGRLTDESWNSTLRSLAIRDGQIHAFSRDYAYHDCFVKPLYDTVLYVLTAVIAEHERRPLPGISARALVIPAKSWIPIHSLGWDHVLRVLQSIEDLVVLCPWVSAADAEEFAENREGCLHLAHLRGLALYLNIAGFGGAFPCPNLERIQVRSSAEPHELPVFNTLERRRSGCRDIALVIL